FCYNIRVIRYIFTKIQGQLAAKILFHQLLRKRKWIEIGEWYLHNFYLFLQSYLPLSNQLLIKNRLKPDNNHAFILIKAGHPNQRTIYWIIKKSLIRIAIIHKNLIIWQVYFYPK